MARAQNKANSWKSTIAQSKGKRAATAQSRLRKVKFLLKFTLFLMGAIGIGLLIWASIWGYQQTVRWITQIAPAACLEHVEVHSDGVLTSAWVLGQIQPSWGERLSQVDIYRIKADLEKNKQIKQATVERLFPQTIKIRLQEAQPILRIAVQQGYTKPIVYLVSEQGELYIGHHYPAESLAALPFLEGVRLEKNPQGGYFPIAGAYVLAELLDVARTHYPEIYGKWKNLSGERFSGKPQAIGASIKVRTQQGNELIFAPMRFEQQLERLRYILAYLNEHQTSFKKIDLTLEDQATVELYNGRQIIPTPRTPR